MNHAARSRERQLSALTPPPPLYATAVVGYRGWVIPIPLFGSEPRLKPMVSWSSWQPGINTASCAPYTLVGSDRRRQRTPCATSPGPCGECGFYAVRDLDRIPLMNYHGSAAEPDRRAVVAWGAIAAWGRVEVHETGFRAEYARILCLTLGEAIAHVSDQGPSGWSTIEEMITWTAAEQQLVRRAAERYRVPYVNRDDLAAEALLHGDPPPTLEEIQ